MSHLFRTAAAFMVFALSIGSGTAIAGERISFATDWRAQAEHGGFYQALALGLYAERGLEVEIRPGGPGSNVPQIFAAGAVDFAMGSNGFSPLNLIREGAPIKAVMSSFQKDPQVILTHPRPDVQSLADIKGKPVMIADSTITGFWVWLKAKYGYTDSQIRKYTFNLAPFLLDPLAIQQGYLASEPYLIEQESGTAPQVFLLADNGYPGYAAMVMVPDAWIAEKPAAVQGFVDATIEGWYRYIYGDPGPANALIKADNPEMSDDMLAQAIAKLRDYGVVDSGDSETLGVGAMTDERWAAFFEVMSDYGVYDKTLDYRRAYTLDFVNKGVGLALRPDAATGQ